MKGPRRWSEAELRRVGVEIINATTAHWHVSYVVSGGVLTRRRKGKSYVVGIGDAPKVAMRRVRRTVTKIQNKHNRPRYTPCQTGPLGC
jgi:CTP:molybdopterin cytidylyltransferase MocA